MGINYTPVVGISVAVIGSILSATWIINSAVETRLERNMDRIQVLVNKQSDMMGGISIELAETRGRIREIREMIAVIYGYESHIKKETIRPRIVPRGE